MRYLFHPSTLLLLAANILTIFFAWLHNWNVIVVMLLFVIQGIIIGVLHYFKVLRLTAFSTDGFSKNFPLGITGKYLDISSLDKESAKQKTAGFFLFVYLFFHFIYLLFLGFLLIFFPLQSPLNASSGFVSNPVFSQVFSMTFLLAVLSYLFMHVVSFYLFRDEQNQPVDLGTFFWEPFIRIVPIHVTIIVSFFIMMSLSQQYIVLYFVLGLKTVLDVVLHVRQHGQHSLPGDLHASRGQVS